MKTFEMIFFIIGVFVGLTTFFSIVAFYYICEKGDINAAMEEKFERFIEALLGCVCVYGVLSVVAFVVSFI